jgi:hypothetical protein
MDSAGLEFSSLLSQAPAALSFRYWPSGKLGLDALGSLQVASTVVKVDLAGNTAPVQAAGIGLGLGARWNLAHPSDDLFLQSLVRASFFHATNHLGGSSPATFDASSLTLLAGMGFEAFLPWWESLSLEASVEVVLARYTTGSDLAALPSSNASSLGLAGKGFYPVQVGIHYYF